MHAILLAAGEGSRLRPLTATQPKPMIRVAGKPVMQYAIEALAENGIRELTLVVGYQREKVQSYFEDGKRFGCRISYVFQDALLGTGHALAQVDAKNEDVIVLGADNIVDGRLVKDILSARAARPGDVTLVAKASDNPSKYGVLVLEGTKVLHIEEKPSVSSSEFVNTGVYALPGRFAAVLRREVRAGTLGLTQVLDTYIRGGGQVHAVRSQGTWMDAVYPWDLLDINAHLLADERTLPPEPNVARTSEILGPVHMEPDTTVGPQATILPSTVLGQNVTVGAGAILENCVVFDDVQIGPGAILRNSIVGEGVRIGPRFTALSGACEVRVADGYHAVGDFGCVIGPDTVIGGSVTVEPGILVGTRARVGSGAVLRRNVENDALVV